MPGGVDTAGRICIINADTAGRKQYTTKILINADTAGRILVVYCFCTSTVKPRL
jgi:hypothetical protein